MKKLNKSNQERKILSTLKKIRNSSQLYRSEAFAQKNILKDLKAIELRLRSREYLDTNFEDRNAFDILRRTREYYQYWLGFLNQVKQWEVILSVFHLESINKIIDLGPGWAPKISMALYFLGFRGELYLIDRDPEALSNIMRISELMKNSFRSFPVRADIFKGDHRLSAQLVIGNHLIDDLILFDYCTFKKMDLMDLYENENAFKQTTVEIISDKRRSKKLVLSISRALNTYIENGGFLILSHYSGLGENALQLKEWNQYVLEMMFEIEALLLKEQGFKRYSKKGIPKLSRSSSKMKIVLLQKKKNVLK